jgi:microcystin-dependent protein
MLLDWGDFSSDSGVEDTPLLISIRTQSLLLTALAKIQRRWNWVEVDDAIWDDIDGAISQATHEVMDIAMSDFSPVGTIVAYAGVVASIPAKYQICDGHLLLAVDYPELRDVLDTPFDDNTYLTIPDLRDRFIYGASSNSELGLTGGAATVALAINELPAHTHTVAKGNGIGNSATTVVEGDNVAPSTATINTGSVGSGSAHQNLPPYMRLFYIMKVLP